MEGVQVLSAAPDLEVTTEPLLQFQPVCKKELMPDDVQKKHHLNKLVPLVVDAVCLLPCLVPLGKRSSPCKLVRTGGLHVSCIVTAEHWRSFEWLLSVSAWTSRQVAR